MRRRSILLAGVLLLFGSALLPLSPTLAQDVTVPESAVTVIGYGEASVPAENAIIQIAISDSNFGGPPVVVPGATPGARDREEVAGAVAALVDAGVAEEDIQVFVGPYVQNIGFSYGPPLAVIQFPLETPDNAQLDELVNAATVAAADESLLIGQVGALFGVADCQSLTADAREAAIADAREQAEVQAELLGVEIGEITASADMLSTGGFGYGYYGPFGGVSICSPITPSPDDAGLYSVPGYDPASEPEVYAYAQIQLSFAIEEVLEATPAG